MRRKNLWRDKDGNYLPSKCSTKFLDKLEMIFNCKIEREFPLRYGPNVNQVRYYDGRYKDYLFELDGKFFHRTNKQKSNDKFKERLAENNHFKLIRLPLNSTKDVDKVFAENSLILQEVFDEKPQFSGTLNIIDKISLDFE